MSRPKSTSPVLFLLAAAACTPPTRSAAPAIEEETAAIALRATPSGHAPAPPTLARETAPADAPVAIVRLLDRLGEDSLSAEEKANFARLLEQQPPGKPLLREEFDGQRDPADARRSLLPQEWRTGASLKPGEPAVSRHWGVFGGRDPTEDATVAIVLREAAGLLRDFPLPEQAAAVIRARVRVARGATSGRLQFEPLASFVEPVPPHGRENEKLHLRASQRASGRNTAPLDPDSGEDWQVVSLFVGPQPSRRGLRLVLQADAGALLVDWVEVSPVEPWRTEFAQARDAGDASALPWRRVLRRGKERADCLVLPHGADVELDVQVPAQQPRLTFGLAPLDPRRELPSRLRLRVDNEELATPGWTPGLAGAPVHFVSHRVALDRFAGRRVRLAFAAEGAEEGGLLVAAPLLLGVVPQPRPPSVILLSIDTLRADHLGCYGAAAGTTPRIDELAAAGTRFANFVATTSWTLPAHATMLSGQLPLVHGATRPLRGVNPRRTPLLGRIFADAGYATAAFTGGGFVDPTFGFADGFDVYSTRDPGRPDRGGGEPASVPMAPVIAWLREQADRPFFLFIHTFLVHDYAPVDAFVEPLTRGSGRRVRPASAPQLREAAANGDEDALADLRLLYRAALTQADDWIVGAVIDLLRALGLESSTVVALVSDHGEEWLEHGGLFHGSELWRELVAVPWILRGPGVPTGRVAEEAVSQVDVAPTLLALAGRPQLPFAQGLDALAAREDGEDPRPILAHVEDGGTLEVAALVAGPWKFLLRRPRGAAAPFESLFRIDRDPLERDDLAELEPERRRELRRLLERSLESCRALGRQLHGGAEAAVDLGPELVRELRELGYLHHEEDAAAKETDRR